MNPRTFRLDARAVADGTGFLAAPGSLLVRFDHPEISHAATLLAAGTPAEVARHPEAPAARAIPLPTSILFPGLVNAHTHLDLTHIGPQPHDPDAGFVAWVDIIRARRAASDDQIAESIRRGIDLSLAGGVVAVGDIGGAVPPGRPTLTPWRILRDSPLLGVSYLEFFAIGRTAEARLAFLDELLEGAVAEMGGIGGAGGSGGVRLGLQPHAPYSVGLRAYRWAVQTAARLGFPLTTHLAETPEERRFIANADGPQRVLLERIGVWDDALLGEVGRGRHPVAHLADILAARPFTLAHVNDADDAAIATLAAAGSTVVYCPRASAYFAAERHFGPHRYRDMLAAGIPVALGTDSVVNLEHARRDGPLARLSVLDEMRFLHQRDGVIPVTLLQMGTIHGAAGIGLDPRAFTFAPSGPGMSAASAPRPVAGVVAVDLGPAAANPALDPLEHLMRGDAPPSLLSGEIFFD